MKRIMLDTNIYGRLVAEKEIGILILKIKSSDIKIYGFRIIKKELRDVPKNVKHEKRSLRIDLINLYSELVKKSYLLDNDIKGLAEKYYFTYRKLGGIKNKREIINDFYIVACASIKELNLVVTEDQKTMLSEPALKAYDIVNNLTLNKTPEFINYSKFKRWLIW